MEIKYKPYHLLLLLLLLLLGCSSATSFSEEDVISIHKKIDVNDHLHSMCISISLSKHDVITYYTVAEEVSEGEFGYSAIISPCSYHGEIIKDGQLFQWEIFAGGSSFLYSEEESRRFLCRNQCCKYFSTLC